MTYAYRGNGAAMPMEEPDTWDRLRKWTTPWAMFNAFATLLIFLIATNWLMIPARSSDLEKTQVQLESLGAKVDKLDASLLKVLERVEASIEQLKYSQQQNREEIIRLGAARMPAEIVSAEPPAPIVVVKKVKPKRRPPVVKAAEQPSLLDKLTQ